MRAAVGPGAAPARTPAARTPATHGAAPARGISPRMRPPRGVRMADQGNPPSRGAAANLSRTLTCGDAAADPGAAPARTPAARTPGHARRRARPRDFPANAATPGGKDG